MKITWEEGDWFTDDDGLYFGLVIKPLGEDESVLVFRRYNDDDNTYYFPMAPGDKVPDEAVPVTKRLPAEIRAIVTTAEFLRALPRTITLDGTPLNTSRK